MNDARSPKGPTHWVDQDPDETLGRPHPGWVRAAMHLAEVVFATEDGPAPAGRVAWLGAELEDFVDRIGVRSKALLRSCVLAVDRGAPLFVGRLGRASRLPFETRVEALERYEKSPLGLSLFALKAILCILWFEHPDSASEIGFDARCHGETPNLPQGEKAGGR